MEKSHHTKFVGRAFPLKSSEKCLQTPNSKRCTPYGNYTNLTYLYPWYCTYLVHCWQLKLYTPMRSPSSFFATFLVPRYSAQIPLVKLVLVPSAKCKSRVPSSKNVKCVPEYLVLRVYSKQVSYQVRLRVTTCRRGCVLRSDSDGLKSNHQ